MKKSTSGFTLIELLVVAVVISILVTITVVVYSGVQGRARDDRRRSDVANIVKALELYYSDNNTYPIGSGTGSIKGSTWYTSGDTSWSLLQTTLTTAKAIDAVPVDPTNTPSGYPDGTGMYTYALYVNNASYCGAAAGQMYIIVYRFETQPKENFSDGTCSINELGNVYTSAGASYYRSVH